MKVAVVFDSRDARSLAESGIGVERVLALTPDAEIALAGFPGRVETSVRRMRRLKQALVLARVLRTERIVERELAVSSYGEAARQVVRQAFYWLAFFSARAWYVLEPKTTYLIPSARGEWIACPDRRSAHAALVRHLLRRSNRWDLNYAPPFGSAIYRAFRRLVIRLSRSGRWFASGGPKLRFGLAKALYGATPPFAHLSIEPAASGSGEYGKLIRGFYDFRRRRTPILTVAMVDARNEGGVEAKRIFSAIADPIVREPIGVDLDKITALIGRVEGWATDSVAILRAAKATAFLSYENNDPETAPIAQAALAIGTRSVVLNHNTLVRAPESPIADAVSAIITRQRIANRLADRFLHWSPLQAAATASLVPVAAAASAGIVIDESGSKLRNGKGEFRVLHAGNYLGWNEGWPWIGETSEEYGEDIRELAFALNGMEGVRVDFRLRPKGECNLSAVTRMLPPSKNLRAVGTDQPFGDHLAESDLLVCFMSTTIEQALQSRVPVLLWGPTGRYRHLPASEDPPSPSKRSAVYVADSGNVREMITAIRLAHFGRPLTDSEIAPYVWPKGTPGISDVPEILADDRFRPLS